jgi:hypothetical protein
MDNEYMGGEEMNEQKWLWNEYGSEPQAQLPRLQFTLKAIQVTLRCTARGESGTSAATPLLSFTAPLL